MRATDLCVEYMCCILGYFSIIFWIFVFQYYLVLFSILDYILDKRNEGIEMMIVKSATFYVQIFM